MRILAMSDIHGHHAVYRAIPRLVADHRAEALVLAGDLLGASPGFDTIEEAQRDDARRIVDILNAADVPILYIMGNDDMIELEPPGEPFRPLHGRRIDLGGYSFVGYQYSLPFMAGVFERPEPEIAADLAALEPLMDESTVLVTHNPAFGIMDVGVLDLHAGSPSILAAVRRRGVRAHIHGHIHACFGREGVHFNVAGGGELRGIVLDLDSMRHEIAGAGGDPA